MGPIWVNERGPWVHRCADTRISEELKGQAGLRPDLWSSMRTFFASGSTSSNSKSTPKHSLNLFADEVQTLQHLHEIGKSGNGLHKEYDGYCGDDDFEKGGR